MLIWIEEVDENELNEESAQIFLEKLAIAFKEGNICLFGNDESLEKIKNSNFLSRVAKSSFTFLLSQYSEYGGRYSKIKTQFRIQITQKEIYKKVVGEGKVLLYCDYRKIPSYFNQPVTLLSENHTDANLYDLIARSCNPYSNLRVGIKAITVGGGGSTIIDHINDYYNKRPSLFICIVDSDIKHPMSALGDTAKKVKGSIKSDDFFSDYKILDVHEAENIIPDEVIEDLFFRKNDNKITALDIYKRISSIDERSLLYIDLKYGLNANKAIELDSSYQEKFWSDLLLKMGGVKQCCLASLQEEHEPCGCVLFEGFGPKVLESSLENLQSRSITPIIRQMSTWKRELWEDIGAWVVEWACCPKEGARRC